MKLGRLGTLAGAIAMACGLLIVGTATPALAWTGWTEVPGYGQTPSAPAVATSGELFVRGTDNRIHWNNRVNGAYVGWTQVPGYGATETAPAVVREPSGLWVAVRGTDGYVHTNVYKDSTWRGWLRLNATRQTWSSPALAKCNCNHPQVFIRGTDDKIYNFYNSPSGPPGGTWNEVPGGGLTSNAPAAFGQPQLSDGRIVLVVRGDGGRIYHNKMNSGGGWTGWIEWAPQGWTTDTPAISGDYTGNITVFVRGTDGYIYQSRGGWSRVSSSQTTELGAGPSAAYTPDGHFVFMTGSGNQRIYRSSN